ncbi:MAG: amidohydrolase family protein [Acidobacteria bacterium]|nr:amidohydrolase family protein [Acidobacteriota bacterium]
MNRRFYIITVVFLLIGTALPTFAQDVLIKNGTVLTVTKGTIENGDVLIKKGIITRIGNNIEAPAGFKVIDATGLYVMPGIIDSHTHIALTGTNEGTDAITSEVKMRDVINSEDPGIFTALSGGVTMVHTMHGSANPIAGENVTLKLKWGKTAEDMLVSEAFRTLKFALGENPKRANSFGPTRGTPRYPQTRMGVIAIIRREFLRAKQYKEDWDRYNQAVKKNKRLIPPRKDLRLEPLVEMLEGKMFARVHAYQADETLEFIALAKEMGFKIACFEHVSEAFKITKELVEENIGISIFADGWAYKMEASQGIAYNAGYATKKGVLVSINSDSGERIRRLFNDAAKAMKYGGLNEEEALRLITINPAIQLGVDKIVGSLEVGKHGDIALFREHPMSIYTRCEKTIVEGEVYFDREVYLKEQSEKEKNASKKGDEK